MHRYKLALRDRQAARGKEGEAGGLAATDLRGMEWLMRTRIDYIGGSWKENMGGRGIGKWLVAGKMKRCKEVELVDGLAEDHIKRGDITAFTER